MSARHPSSYTHNGISSKHCRGILFLGRTQSPGSDFYDDKSWQLYRIGQLSCTALTLVSLPQSGNLFVVDVLT